MTQGDAYADLTATLPAPLQPIARLATNLRWVWNHAADRVWETLAPEVWQQTANPVLVLQNTPRSRLEQLAQNADFVERVRALDRSLAEYLGRPSWFQRTAADAERPLRVAYFSMEYGLTDALPLYSGGLGVLAGDHLKTASDLGVPLTAVGLVLSRGLLPADAGRRRHATRDLRGECAAVAARAPGRGLGRHAIARGHRTARTRAAVAHLAGRRRPRGALPARQRRPAQLPVRSRHHGPAVRRRRRDAFHAGDRARHRRLARAAGARHRRRRLPSQRRPRGARDARASAHVRRRSAVRFLHRTVGHAGRQRVHDPHAGRGRVRHVCTAAAAQVRRGVREPRRHQAAATAGPRPPQPGRRVRAVQHGLSRGPHLRLDQWCERAARRGQPAHLRPALPALARGRSARDARDQCRARAVLGLALGRPAVDRSLRQGPLARRAATAQRRGGRA